VFGYPRPHEPAGHRADRTSAGASAPADSPAGGASAADDEEIRRVLSAIPVAALRESGLLDTMLRIGAPAVPAAQATAAPDGRGDAIRPTDADDLIRMALGDQGDVIEPDGLIHSRMTTLGRSDARRSRTSQRQKEGTTCQTRVGRCRTSRHRRAGIGRPYSAPG
jgi:hypothetical protein